MYLFKDLPPTLVLILVASAFPLPALAQYPPPAENVTTIHSPVNKNITISYKTPPVGTCTTVFSDQKQYAGYVTLPPYTLAPIQQNYTVNSFFWFIEARTKPETAPLTIYINGGPGSSSMVGLFQETGPCEVIEMAEGQLGTRARDWGWDRSSNVLYVDQPNLVGFSYDETNNGTLDLLTGTVSTPGTKVPDGQPAYTHLNGTFGSNNPRNSPNTTAIAGHAVWHMLQGFLSVFPQYNPGTQPNSTTPGIVGVNLFAESYGGKFGPNFAKLWEEQNDARNNGSLSAEDTVEIRLSSLGIMQGCIDDLVQGRYYPIFANNNTYGIQALSIAEEQTAASAFIAPGGCSDLIQRCRAAISSLDPENDGDVDSVNNACQEAQQSCNDNVIGPYQVSGRDVYDISQMNPDTFPTSSYLEYLNYEEVQAGIGAAVNYSQISNAVSIAFLSTGDYDRGTQVSDMAYLLAQGVRVALIYGDRDYICNWLGGEAVSFSIAAESPSLAPFYSAGYAQIVVNSTYVGGVVRQYGNLSFSRIYDAGHLIPAYQAETAFTVFTRVIMGTELSTGEPINLKSYVSKGDANATHQNKVPDAYPPVCFVRNIAASCTDEQIEMIKNGEGVVINGVLYDHESDWKEPASTVSEEAGQPGTLPASMTATTASLSSKDTSRPPSVTTNSLTGVYVATATPTSSNAAVPTRLAHIAMYLSPFAAAALVV